MGGIGEMEGVWLGGRERMDKGEGGGESHQISTHVIHHQYIWSILSIMNFSFFNKKKTDDPLNFGRGSKISYGRGRGLPGYVL